MATNLSKELLAELKNKLESKKAVLEREIGIINSEDSYNNPERTVGNAEDADEASEDTSHLENRLKEQNTSRSLALVEKALAKMEVGTYGICEIGGEEIGVARLQVFPEAETCIEHAGKNA